MESFLATSGDRESVSYEGPRVRLCQDGKYRWTYKFPMLKNPAIILVVYKIFGVLLCIPFVIHVISLASDGTLHSAWNERLWSGSNPKIWLMLMALFFVIILVSYLILSWLYGGKFIVHFTMDETQIIHEQDPVQFKHAKKIGLLTALVGLFTKKPAMAGQGMVVASRSVSTSDFAGVRRIKPRRFLELIKVNKLLDRNQVYVPKEDFDFVLDYIRNHCPKAK